MANRQRSRPIGPRSLIVAIVAGFAAVAFAGANEWASIGYNSGSFHGCSPSGDGGDSIMNRLKNRDVEAPWASEFMTLTEIKNIEVPNVQAEGETNRSNWELASQQEAAFWEDKFVVTEGYLVASKRMGEESCNCHSATYKDYHLWLVRYRTHWKDKSVVAEISPRMLPSHPTWTTANLNALAASKAKVQVHGWLFYDQEHTEQLGEHRATLWEIHPVHAIYVWEDGEWVEL